MTIKTGAGEAVADSNGSAPRDDGYVLGVGIPELGEYTRETGEYVSHTTVRDRLVDG